METANSLAVTTERNFNAQPEKVYQAWISKEALQQWWRPMGNMLTHLENEVREGGKLAYHFETPEGEEAFTIEGEYDRVEEGRLLSYSWNWKLPVDEVEDTDFHLTIEFIPSNGGTLLKVRQDQFSSEEALHPHREGWETGLNNLEAYLQR